MQLYADGNNVMDDITESEMNGSNIDEPSNYVSSFEQALEVDNLPSFKGSVKPLRAIAKKRKVSVFVNDDDTKSLPCSETNMNTSLQGSDFTGDGCFHTSSSTSNSNKQLKNFINRLHSKTNDVDQNNDEGDGNDVQVVVNMSKINCECGDESCQIEDYPNPSSIRKCKNVDTCDSECRILENCKYGLCEKCIDFESSTNYVLGVAVSSNLRPKSSRLQNRSK